MRFLLALFLFWVAATSGFAQMVVLTDSNLPIVTIDTDTFPIPMEPKVRGDMKIYYHANGSRNYLTDAPAYVGEIGIEIRGASSSAFPKKCYGFETWDSLGNEIDTSLMGMPAESDWILYAGLNDKSLMRNAMACHFYNEMGRYASRTQHCELILNGQYWGVYLLMEKIKRDPNRVDIAKVNPWDTTGSELTGGYIIKMDNSSGEPGFYSPPPFGIYFMYHYPSGYKTEPQQELYLWRIIDSIQTALVAGNFTDTITGYRHFIDTWSFVDYFLMYEASKNPDAYARSMYFVKQKDTDGGKFQMGPVWDFDLAWRNSIWCNGTSVSGYEYIDYCAYRFPWWTYLFQDSELRNDVKCRWIYLRQQIYSDSAIVQYIDSIALYLQESQQRNFVRWPVLSADVFVNVPPFPQSYQEEIDTLKSFALARAAWLDANLFGVCSTIGQPETDRASPSVLAFPNPFSKEFTLSVNSPGEDEAVVEIRTISGALVQTISSVKLHGGANELKLSPADNLAPGVCIVTVKAGGFVTSCRLVRI